MTLIGAVIQGEQAWLYADSGMFDPDTGILLGTGTKLQQGARFPCAIGVSFVGAREALPCLTMLDTHDADTLFDRLPVAIDRFKRKSLKLGSTSASMTLTCIARDAKQSRPRIFVCGDGLEAFGVQPEEPCEALGYFFEIASDEPAKHWAGSSPCGPERSTPLMGSLLCTRRRVASRLLT